MKPADSTARVLRHLLGRMEVARSSIGPRARRTLQPLFDTGAITEERCPGGWSVQVHNPQAVERLAEALYPEGLEHEARTLDKATAARLLRDTKRGRNQSGEPLLIRAFCDAPLISGRGAFDTASSTRVAGLAAVLLNDDTLWTLDAARVATIENMEPFLRFEQTIGGFDAVIYCGGRMSGRLLRWMESQSFTLVHFGDYDPVGLQEFLRLKQVCGSMVSLYVPTNLDELIRRYGKAELVRDSAALISGLRASCDQQVQSVLNSIEAHGAGLEQEILWAPSGS